MGLHPVTRAILSVCCLVVFACGVVLTVHFSLTGDPEPAFTQIETPPALSESPFYQDLLLVEPQPQTSDEVDI